jgi:thioredoxin reductase
VTHPTSAVSRRLTTHSEPAAPVGIEVVGWGTDERQLEAAGVVVFVGAAAQTEWLSDYVLTDRAGFVVTGGHDRPALATSRDGVFAVGDVRSGSIKRVVSAVGEGSQVVSLVHAHLTSRFARL